MNTKIRTKNIQTSPILWFLILAYAMVIVLANLFDARLIKISHLITDAGTLIFPLTFILSDLITEVYGYKYARRAIWYGFFFNCLFILYGQLIIHLPGPDFETHNALFDTLLALNMRITLASFVSYLVAAPINAMALALLKIKMHGKYMGFRFVTSTAFSALIDSAIFGALAFYGLMPQLSLVTLIGTMWLVKIAIEVAGLPLSVQLATYLKQKEQLDIYDQETRFNLFALETAYKRRNNQYSADVKQPPSLLGEAIH